MEQLNLLTSENYYSHLKIRQIVYYDSLLEIGNGNYLSAVFQRLPKNILPKVYLAVFDIDKFKEFNYIYGEEAGDGLLKYIVRVFREELPEVSLFRYFSDYFVILAQCENEDAYKEIMERLMTRFKADIEKEEIQPFDISVGVKRVEQGEPLRRIRYALLCNWL